MCQSFMEEWHRRLVPITLCLLFSCPVAVKAEAYRWYDAKGLTHYGDNPPDNARSLRQITIDVAESWYRVASVTDGDTVVLKNGRRIRLLGINSPEVAHHGRPGEPFGEQARHFLKNRLEGKAVRLRYDKQRRDRYDRHLAHLFLADGTNINTLMLERGLAHALFKWPNLDLAEKYYALEKQAREHNRGIWALPAYRIHSLENLAPLRNRFVRLRGRLKQIRRKRRYAYLLFDHKLKVRVRLDHLPRFRKAGIELERLVGHRLTLRGWLRQRRGSPYLVLDHPYQLERLK